MGHHADVVERIQALGHQRLDESLRLMTDDAAWRERPYTELRPIAWVYEFEGDLIARVSVFGSWDQARTAAGVPAGVQPTRTLADKLWHPAAAAPRRRWRLAFAPGF